MDSSFRSRRDPLRARRRVVVTGLGAVSAAGLNKEVFWENLLAGRSGIGPITRFDPTGMSSRIAGEVKGFDPVTMLDPRLKPRRMSRQTQLGVAASVQALQDAGVGPTTFADRDVDVVMGVSTSSSEVIVDGAMLVEREGPMQATPWRLMAAGPQPLPATVAGLLAARRVAAHAVASACAAGLDAIGEAYNRIRTGHVDAAVCGGADAPISRTPMAEFSAAGLSSIRNEEPHRASRPFDRERDSGLLAEGGATVVLETLEAARARGARCYMEILGFHACMDPDENHACDGMAGAMRDALFDAACPPGQIDYISAWGSGHPVLDRVETEMIKAVFGARAYQVPVSSIKGIIGNPGSAAGPLQLIAVAMSYLHRLLPPTANYEHLDVGCDLDYVAGQPRRAMLRCTMINAHGLGGGNGSLVVSGPPS